MADEPENTQTGTADTGPHPESRLPRPVQEHLGQQLRTAYHELADKPAFLGDPAVPVEFEQKLQRLDRRERIHDKAVDAVKAALADIAGPDGELPRRGGR